MKVEADRDCFVAALFAMTVRNIEQGGKNSCNFLAWWLGFGRS